MMNSRSADALYRSFCIDQAASQLLLGAVYGRCKTGGGKLTHSCRCDKGKQGKRGSALTTGRMSYTR
jgi:hypothetical protein